MFQFLFILLLSTPLFSEYSVGDQISTDHQNLAFDVCYGDYPYEQLQLSHFNGKISIFGLSTSW